MSLFFTQIPTWERRYGIPDRAEFALGGIVETINGDFVVSGATFNRSPFNLWGIDGYIVKINAYGDTLWTRRVGSMGIGAGMDFIFDVIINSNNELVFTGSRYVNPSVKRQLWFLKLSQNGDSLMDKRIGGAGEDNGGEIIQNPDGTYMILGDTRSFGTQIGGSDVWLLKLNQNGDTIWTKTYDLNYQDNGSGIIPFQNGNYLITTFSVTDSLQVGPWFIAYMGFASYFVIDSSGNVLKLVVLDEDSLTQFADIRPTSDGGAIIAGSRSVYDIFPCRDIWVLKLNANADTVWTKTIGGYGKYDGGMSILQSNNGGYYLAAYSQTYTTPEMDYDNWWLLRLNDNGDTIWTKWWGGPLNDDPSGIIPTSDGGIIIAGWRDANSWDSLTLGPADFWVIKADTNGNVSGIYDFQGYSIHPKEILKIYPNPLNSTATIQFSIPRKNYVSLKIFDVSGAEVAEIIDKELNQGSYSIVYEPHNLTNGIYFVSLKVGNKIYPAKKLLILH
ncbi:MAG: T9SS type A sorting domain-containing protein [bacterium]